MERSKSIRVQIFGTEYPVLDRDPEYTKSVAAYVDARMQDIATSQGLVSSTKAAILAAMDIVHELFQERRKNEQTMNDVAARALQISEVLAREL